MQNGRRGCETTNDLFGEGNKLIVDETFFDPFLRPPVIELAVISFTLFYTYSYYQRRHVILNTLIAA